MFGGPWAPHGLESVIAHPRPAKRLLVRDHQGTQVEGQRGCSDRADKQRETRRPSSLEELAWGGHVALTVEMRSTMPYSALPVLDTRVATAAITIAYCVGNKYFVLCLTTDRPPARPPVQELAAEQAFVMTRSMHCPSRRAGQTSSLAFL